MATVVSLLCSFYILSSSLPAQHYFTWDNATVYFLITDRFFDGNTANNFPYGRTADPVGGFQGGDLKGLTQKITAGYFDSLGVDALWITPPYEQIHGAVPGYWNGYPSDFHYGYHGYYALDFTELDANMGTAADMLAFVDTAHAHGIRIIMDIVLNHVGYETMADVAEFNLGDLGNPWNPNNVPNANDPDWCNWWTDPLGKQWIRKGVTTTDYCADACGGGDLMLCLAGLPDVRTEITTEVGLPQILLTKWNAAREAQEIAELNAFFLETGLPKTPANYIIKWLTDWVREYGIDGFRIDTYKHVERSVWGTLKAQAQNALDDWKAANPSKVLDDNDFWMVGEWYGHGPNKNTEAATVGQTDALINFGFQGQGGNPSALNSTYASYAAINADPTWNFLSYISSHDTELFNRNDLFDGGTSLLLAPGAVQIFYGDETMRMPLTTGTDQDTRSFMNWGSINYPLKTHWSLLGTFRRKHPAIGVGTHTMLNASPYVFMRDYQSVSEGVCDKIVAAVGVPAGNQTFNVAAAFADGVQVRNVYSGQVANVANGQITFNVGSQGVVLMEYVTQPACVVVDIEPEDCYSANPVTVTITAADIPNPNIQPTIFYSFNPNANPSNPNDWTTYTVPFVLSQSQTVLAFAQNTNGDRSEVLYQHFIIGPNPAMTLYWNPQGSCSTPRLYAWDLNGLPNTAVAPWPGVQMTDPDGDGWFEYTLNAAYANVIFNCGSNQNQTGNLFACGNACFIGSPANGAWGNCPSFGPSVNINPAGGNYPGGSASVTLTAGPGTCTIYYTTDGSTPTTSSTLYSGAFTVNGSPGNPVTVKAIASCGGNLTPVKSASFTFEIPPPPSTMTLYWNPQGTCSTPKLYAWNLNGQSNTAIAPWPGVNMTDPDGDGWYEYTITAEFASVIFNCGSSQNQTGNLSAAGTSCFLGSTSTGAWVNCPNFGAATVDITPESGNFHLGSATLSISGINLAAAYYTTNGSTPDSISGQLYTQPFPVTSAMGSQVVVKAIGYNNNGEPSDLVTETYTFAPGMTLYWNSQGTCSTPRLYAWNLNGQPNTAIAPWPGVPMTDPDGDGWFEYTLSANSAMVIFNCGSNQNQTADLSATGNSCFQGSTSSGAWVNCPDFNDPSVTIVPDGGLYASGAAVPVQLIWAEATQVYYTTDGSVPNNTSTPYTGIFNITGSGGDTVVVKAIAYSTGYPSLVKTSRFVFGQNCPPALNLTGTLDPGMYQAGQTITTDGTVGAGEVLLRATQGILLNPGFEVTPAANGGTLTVEIGGCGN
jgi:alpha-amylase